jgi:hypothetical protein
MLLSQASAWNATPTKATKTGPNKRIAAMRELLQQQSSVPVAAFNSRGTYPTESTRFTPAPYNYQGAPRVAEVEADAYPAKDGFVSQPTVIPKPMIEQVSITDDGSGLADFKPVNKGAPPQNQTVVALVPSERVGDPPAPQKRPEGFTHQQQPMQSIQQNPVSAYKSMGVEYNRAYSPPEYDWLPTTEPLYTQHTQYTQQREPLYQQKREPLQSTPPLDLQQISMDEKLSRILFLLEESRMEQTQYVGEEIALYTLLGAFVIGVLDSFVHLGKYVR